jgi:hypothetical protein
MVKTLRLVGFTDLVCLQIYIHMLFEIYVSYC